MKRLLLFACILVFAFAADSIGESFVNSIGMKLVRIEPGSFNMGFGNMPLSDQIVTGKGMFTEGDYDEHPTHRVQIGNSFNMAVYEVTNKQYELFDPEHRKLRLKDARDDAAVVNVNWYDAQAFCRWLSDKEGKPYRLPTEAEWEYACRAGSITPYCTGPVLPPDFDSALKRPLTVGQTPANAWGLQDMHGNVEEWCYDWYGPYEAGLQVDPVGRVRGEFRVLRGGSHSTNVYYLRSSNRLGTVPEDKHDMIGFRVVQGEPPKTDPLPEPPLQRYQTGVNQKIPRDVDKGPDPDKPYFHPLRPFVKVPNTNRGPLYSQHSHFMSIVDCPNGDLISIWHTCIGESGRELAVAASRLRYGQEQWEPASLFWDAPDRNDHGHALWFDGKDTIYHFQGLARRSRNTAIVLRTSKDNGVTWSAPRIVADHGPSTMPIESVFRTKDGSLVISCDKGPNVIWISRDEGLNWTKSKGKIRGKHAAACQLTDGRLMAFGRDSNLEGMMPISVSADMGETWEYSPSIFQPVSWGQRPVVLRLKEGPLFFGSFCKRIMIKTASGKQHPISGLFGAVSFDDGKTWPHMRLITDDAPTRDIETMNAYPATMDTYTSEFCGYLSVCQAADGVIHLIGSRQHYAFNLKWLMTPPPDAPTRPPLPKERTLPTKAVLANVYKPTDVGAKDNPGWGIRGSAKSQAGDTPSDGPLKIQTEKGQEFWLRSEGDYGFVKADYKKGFTVEFKVQVSKSLPNQRGFDLELYDGASSRYALTLTDNALYWYEGLVIGTAMLAFDQFTPVVEGLDNTDALHTYRVAVREDRVVQFYRDGKLIGVRRAEYRTPREAYMQFGTGRGVEALLDYVAYDLDGPFQP